MDTLFSRQGKIMSANVGYKGMPRRAWGIRRRVSALMKGSV